MHIMSNISEDDTLQEWFYKWITTPGAFRWDIYFDNYNDRDEVFCEHNFDEELFYRLAKHCIIYYSHCEMCEDDYVRYPYMGFMVNSEYMSYLLDMEKYAVGIRYDEDDYENNMAENIISKNEEETGFRGIRLAYMVLDKINDNMRRFYGDDVKGNTFYYANYREPIKLESWVMEDYVDKFVEEGYCTCMVMGDKDSTLKEMIEDLCKIFEAKPVGEV